MKNIKYFILVVLLAVFYAVGYSHSEYKARNILKSDICRVKDKSLRGCCSWHGGIKYVYAGLVSTNKYGTLVCRDGWDNGSCKL